MFNVTPGCGSVDPWSIEDVVRAQRSRFLVPVTQPLILISEIQRSGGTLLTQLLDGHPQLHVHPSELHIGRPNKYHWPSLNLDLPAAELFEQLWEHPALLHARDGYSKPGRANNAPLPFIFLGGLQRELFAKILGTPAAASQREVLNAYATSYFNAWLDYRGLYREPANVKYWVSFVARLSFDSANMAMFHRDYPDGLFVSVVRDPVSWFASAARYMPSEYGDVPRSCELWNASTESAIREYERYPERVLLLSFEELVTSPGRVLKRLCRFAKIGFHEEVLSPTFNGIPIQGNSSFDTFAGRVSSDSRDRSAHVLPEVRARIMLACSESHAAAKRIIIAQRKSYGEPGE